MKFVQFEEINDNEGEEWNFWLQLDGNEEELKKLSSFLSKFDEYGEEFSLKKMDSPISEEEVDILVKHSKIGYMSYENKVTGKFTCPTTDISDEDEGFEWLSDNFYKGDIMRHFK